MKTLAKKDELYIKKQFNEKANEFLKKIVGVKTNIHKVSYFFKDDILDLHSKKILEDKISKFNGTILFISHDRHFIDKISTKIAAISNKKIKVYDGNYSYYKAKTADEAISLDPVKKSSKQTVKNKKEKESTKKKNPSKMKMLEKRMKDIEFEISRIDMDILNSLSNYSKLGELNEQKSSFEKEYESLLEEYYD